MNLWQVRADNTHIAFGERRRRKLHSQACNEPFLGRFWCPERRWFSKSPCPFQNRGECDCFKKLCGAL